MILVVTLGFTFLIQGLIISCVLFVVMRHIDFNCFEETAIGYNNNTQWTIYICVQLMLEIKKR